MFAPPSVNEAETCIGLDVVLRPLGIPYHDRRRVIVVVERLESLTYHGNRWVSGYWNPNLSSSLGFRRYIHR